MSLIVRRNLPLLALVVVMLVMFLPLSPLFRPLPGRDAGIYLYSGDQILHGARPYRDVWDNRPPGLFYLSAVGLALGGGSIWGPWVLEAFFLCGAAALSFLTLRRALSAGAAFVATFIWTITLVYLYDFNIAEEYALLFQFGTLYYFIRAEERGRYGWYGVGIGACLALAANLRQNLIGIWIALVIFLLARAAITRSAAAIRALLAVAGGVALVYVPIILYFGARGVLQDMWDGAYVFNFVYVGTTWAKRLDSLGMGATLLLRSGLLLAALAGGLIGLYDLARRHVQPLIAVALLAAPVDLLLSSLSGRPYPHYFISSLPALAVLAALFFEQVLKAAQASFGGGARRPPVVAWVVGLSLAASILPLRTITTLEHRVFAAGSSRARLIAYIARNTAPTDTIFLWGADMMINLGSGRKSPTRLTNNYPLFMPGYQSPALIQSFVDELKRNPPAYIIDTAYTNRLIPPLNATDRQRWIYYKANGIDPRPESDDFTLIPAMDIFFDYVDSHYHRAFNLSVWIIYMRNDFQPLVDR